MISVRKAYILSGISGSGKSTYAQATWPNAVVCSADHHFAIDGEYRFDPTKLGEAHAKCFRLFVESVRLGSHAVVCDNTNTCVEEIAPYVLAATAYGYDPTIITFECDLSIAANRNVHNVPTSTIDRQRRNMLSMLARGLPPYWAHERRHDGTRRECAMIRFYIVERSADGSTWKSEIHEARDMREVRQTIIVGFLGGAARHAEDENGVVLYGLDAKGKVTS